MDQHRTTKLNHDNCDCSRISKENKRKMCPTIFIVQQWADFSEKESRDNLLFEYKYDTYKHYVENFGNLYCRCKNCIDFLKENNLFDKNIRNKLSPLKLQKTFCPGKYSRHLYVETGRDAMVANADREFKERIKNVTLEIGLDLSLLYCHCETCREWSEEFIPIYIKRTLPKNGNTVK